MNYFKNKDECRRRAEAHYKKMEETYPHEISRCARRSIVITGSADSFIPNFPATDLFNVGIMRNTTTYAIENEAQWTGYGDPDDFKNQYGTKIAVLNFASFKNPGGMFLNGSMAQEESLCHESFLYNVLSQPTCRINFYMENKKLLNRSLYANRGVFSPGVRFIFSDGNTAFADVFTVAAPNAGSARRLGVSEKEVTDVLRKRIHFVIQNMLSYGPYKSVILGAFGCGVFKNSPELVAMLFYKELDNIECRKHFGRVIFAIVGDGHADTFSQVLAARRDSFGDNHLPLAYNTNSGSDTDLHTISRVSSDSVLSK